jgi:hypothetical protein
MFHVKQRGGTSALLPLSVLFHVKQILVAWLMSHSQPYKVLAGMVFFPQGQTACETGEG